jgi:hypothetical protein
MDISNIFISQQIILFTMSYQQQQYQTSNLHRLNEFVPTYVPHSDFLPNKVVDSSQPELQQWVLSSPSRSPTMSNKKDSDMSTPKNPWSSIPADTSQSAPMRTSSSTDPSQNRSSIAGSRECDLFRIIIIANTDTVGLCGEGRWVLNLIDNCG